MSKPFGEPYWHKISKSTKLIRPPSPLTEIHYIISDQPTLWTQPCLSGQEIHHPKEKK